MADEIKGTPASPGTSTPFSFAPAKDVATERASAPFPDVEAERLWIAGRVEAIANAEKDHRLPHEQRWKRNERLMNNEHDWRGKATWQSQIEISKVPNAVNAQLAILKGGLVQTKDWFDMDAREGTDPLDQALLADLKDLLRAELEERDPYTRRDFLDEWLLALKGGLVNSMLVMKFYPVEDLRPVRVFKMVDVGRAEAEAWDGLGALEAQVYGQPRLETGVADEATPESMMRSLALAAGPSLAASGEQPTQAPTNPSPAGAPPARGMTSRIEMRKQVRIAKDGVPTRDYFWDSTGRRKYEFQRIQGDLDELNRMTTEAGYIESAVARVKAKCSPKVPESEMKRVEGRPSEAVTLPPHRVGWEGWEFYGDIQGPDGELLRRNATITVIEGVVVRDKENPFDDGSPFRACALEPMHDSTYGRAPLENVAGIAHFITELANAIIDATTYEVLKMWEIDVEMLDAATNLQTGAAPGKVWWKRDKFGTGKPLIQPVDTGRVPVGAINLLTWADRQFQEGTSVTEISHGLQPIRGFPTATEISARQQNTNTSFRALAQWCEKGSLEPCLEAVFNRMMQFKVFADGGPSWCSKVLGKARAEQFYQRLYQRIQEDDSFEVSIEFRVHALSSILARASETERLARMLEVLRQFPGLANRLKLEVLAKRVVATLGYSAEDLLRDEAELGAIQRMEMEAMARLSAAAGQQPNSHTSAGTAAAGIVTPAGA